MYICYSLNTIFINDRILTINWQMIKSINSRFCVRQIIIWTVSVLNILVYAYLFTFTEVFVSCVPADGCLLCVNLTFLKHMLACWHVKMRRKIFKKKNCDINNGKGKYIQFIIIPINFLTSYAHHVHCDSRISMNRTFLTVHKIK